MNFTCNECNDTGSRDKIGTYLDCNACGTASTRRDLNDFVKSLGPTHPEDVALSIHQRALAMAPKQEAPEPVAYLRFRAAQQWSGMGGHDIEHCEWLETCQAHEVGDDKLPAFPVYAAPAAANGALTDEQINTIWESLPGLKIVAGRPIDHWNSLLRHEFARAILAAAGPDAALVALIHKAQSILARHLPPGGPDAKTTISALLGLLDGPESRAALSGAKGN